MIKGRPPRLKPVFDSYTAPLFFVTACTLYRRPFPSMTTATEAFVNYAKRAQSFNIAVGRFVIMPDHLHLFVCGDHNFTLSDWVKGLKRGMSNAFSAGDDRIKCSRDFSIIYCATTRVTARKWNYVRENPVRAGLVQSPDEWPYQGEIVYVDRT